VGIESFGKNCLEVDLREAVNPVARRPLAFTKDQAVMVSKVVLIVIIIIYYIVTCRKASQEKASQEKASQEKASQEKASQEVTKKDLQNTSSKEELLVIGEYFSGANFTPSARQKVGKMLLGYLGIHSRTNNLVEGLFVSLEFIGSGIKAPDLIEFTPKTTIGDILEKLMSEGIIEDFHELCLPATNYKPLPRSSLLCDLQKITSQPLKLEIRYIFKSRTVTIPDHTVYLENKADTNWPYNSGCGSYYKIRDKSILNYNGTPVEYKYALMYFNDDDKCSYVSLFGGKGIPQMQTYSSTLPEEEIFMHIISNDPLKKEIVLRPVVYFDGRISDREVRNHIKENSSAGKYPYVFRLEIRVDGKKAFFNKDLESNSTHYTTLEDRSTKTWVTDENGEVQEEYTNMFVLTGWTVNAAWVRPRQNKALLFAPPKPLLQRLSDFTLNLFP
jgi:hypothetical protein